MKSLYTNLKTKLLRLRIELWLKLRGIKNYTINEDLTIDVDGDVNLRKRNMKKIPFQFGVVKGYFWCMHSGLETLKGSPHTVFGDFLCGSNKLTSLEHAPAIVKGKFECWYNNLSQVENIKTDIYGEFDHATLEKENRILIFKNLYEHDSFSDSYDLKLDRSTFKEIMSKINLAYELHDTLKVPESTVPRVRNKI